METNYKHMEFGWIVVHSKRSSRPDCVFRYYPTDFIVYPSMEQARRSIKNILERHCAAKLTVRKCCVSYGDDMDSMPLFRRTDPRTSREAADKIKSKISRHESEILLLLKRHNGSTCPELNQYSAYLVYEQIHKRMKGMERKGLITRGEQRICRVRGTKMVTWYIRDECSARTRQEV